MKYAAARDGNQPDIVQALRMDAHGIDTKNNAYKNAGSKVCAQCGTPFHSYEKRRKFCSLACNAIAKTVRPDRACIQCGVMFKPNVDGRKYCSKKCNMAAKPKLSGYVHRPRPIYTVCCQYCGNEFRASPSQKRKFCSYSCHLKSGGAQKAGDAAAMAKSKYGAKKDANHAEIFQAIETFTAVKDLSNAGCGIPDGIAWVSGSWHLFDVKNPLTGYGKRGLNDRQKRWADDWRGGPVFLIYSVEEAIRFARGNFDGIKRFPDVVTIPLRGEVS